MFVKVILIYQFYIIEEYFKILVLQDIGKESFKIVGVFFGYFDLVKKRVWGDYN